MASGASDVGVGLSSVAQRYAAALYELSSESRAVDQVNSDLQSVAAMIEGSADLKRLVMSPVFSAEAQSAAMGAILAKAKIKGLAGNFIKLVANKRRLFVLPEMIRAYQAEVARARGIVTAKVTLAESPSAKQINDIKAALKDVAGKEVAIDVNVDPSIIGGIIVKMGSRMVDASLKTKLNSIRTAMKEVG
ncbi:MAG: F0F1 ATP synthase subunit delta [Bosea sp. (in: a-proteobacteria)]